jgi:hypothetical protein
MRCISQQIVYKEPFPNNQVATNGLLTCLIATDKN